MRIRRYSELEQIEFFEDRYDYLVLNGAVGEATFGFDRYLNQHFYASREWRNVRRDVVLRDNGCDLGVEGYPIHTRPIVHHMNPMRIEDIERGGDDLFNPDFLITVSHPTHNAIHYGDRSLLPRKLVERKPGDTLLW